MGLPITGRRVPPPLPRVWVEDMLVAARGVPLVTFERRMRLGDAAAARAASPDPPSWVVLFTKAYAVVAARRPELRRAYVRWPRPHLYEADASVASVAVEREYRGEPAVFFGRMVTPDRQPLADLARALREWRAAPVERVREFDRVIRVARLPRPARRVAWWHAMSSGRRRAKNFGTFGVSVTASAGATARSLISPLATTLTYGVFDRDHALDVRLHFDHRVLDGMTAARALADLEHVLVTDIAAELRWAAPQRDGVRSVEVVTSRGQ